MSKPVPPVGKYMTTSPITVASTEPLARAARLMRAEQIRHLPVVDGDRVVGLVSDRDVAVVEGLAGVDPEQVTVADAMARDPYTTEPDVPITDVARAMAIGKYGSAIVVQNGKVVGILTTVDVCNVLASVFDTRLR